MSKSKLIKIFNFIKFFAIIILITILEKKDEY